MTNADVHADALIWGSELRRRRNDRHMSLTDLAAVVHFDRGYLSRVERGQRRPNQQLIRMCDAAVAADGDLIRLADDLALEEARDAAQEGGEEEVVVRDPDDPFDLIAASAAEIVELRPVGEAAIVNARKIFDSLRQMGHFSPARIVLPMLAAQFGVLRSLARSGGPRLRDQVLLLAAHYAEYAGWMAQETGDERRSLAHTATAARLAREAGALPLAAYTVLRQADIALYQGDGDRVAALAEQIEDSRDAGDDVRLLAAQRAAQGWALAGRPDRCRAALDRAARRNERTVFAGSDRIPLGSSGGGRRMDVVRGWCYLDLGWPEEAADALAAGLALAPPNARRARALFGARLALARVASGDVPGSCAAGERSLDDGEQIESAAGHSQLRLLGRALRRWSGDSAVRHVQHRIERELSLPRPQPA